MALESGRYMETIGIVIAFPSMILWMIVYSLGWMSVDLDEHSRDKTKDLTFTRRYLDQNRVGYEVSGSVTWPLISVFPRDSTNVMASFTLNKITEHSTPYMGRI